MSDNVELIRFSYNYGDPYSDTNAFETSMEFRGDLHISDVLEKFGQFLRGCGFCFDGDIINADLDKYDLVERKPITVTKDFEQGFNINNVGQTAV